MRFLTLLAVVFSLSAFAGGKGAAKKPPPPSKPPPSAPAKPPPDMGTSKPIPGSSQAAAAPAGAPPPTRGPTRIDFDDRLIQGQTNKSGAVYLYDRKELKTKSMIKTRESFRDEIVGSLYDT